MEGEHWIMIASSGHKLYFADSLGREIHGVFKHLYKKMMLEPPLSHPIVRSLYAIIAVFHFKFRQEKTFGVHEVIVFSFIGDNM